MVTQRGAGIGVVDGNGVFVQNSFLGLLRRYLVLSVAIRARASPYPHAAFVHGVRSRPSTAVWIGPLVIGARGGSMKGFPSASARRRRRW